MKGYTDLGNGKTVNCAVKVMSTKRDYISHIKKNGEIIKQADGMNDLFFEFAKPNLDFLSDNLQINQQAAMLFASLINLYNGNYDTIRTLSNYLKVNYIEIIEQLSELEMLKQKRLIQMIGFNTKEFSYGQIQLQVPFTTIDALRKGICHELLCKEKLSISEFFIQLLRIFDDWARGTLSDERAKKIILQEILYDNEHLHFVQKMKTFDLNDDDILVLLHFFTDLVILD